MYTTLPSCTPPCHHVHHPVIMYTTLSSCTPPCHHVYHPVIMYTTLSSCIPPCQHVHHPVIMYTTLSTCTPHCHHVHHPAIMYTSLSHGHHLTWTHMPSLLNTEQTKLTTSGFISDNATSTTAPLNTCSLIHSTSEGSHPLNSRAAMSTTQGFTLLVN